MKWNDIWDCVKLEGPPFVARNWKWLLSALIAAIVVASCMWGCASPTKPKDDRGTTSATLDMTIASNSRALQRADGALQAATKANETIKETIPLLAKEATPGAKSHSGLWKHTNAIENASQVIGSSLDDIKYNQGDLVSRSTEVAKKEADLAARENRMAEIESGHVESVLRTLRLASLIAGALAVGCVLLAIFTTAKSTGWTLAVVCAATSISVLMLSFTVQEKHKDLGNIGYWVILGCMAIGGYALFMFLRVGKKNERALTEIGDMAHAMIGATAAWLSTTPTWKDTPMDTVKEEVEAMLERSLMKTSANEWELLTESSQAAVLRDLKKAKKEQKNG